MIEGLYPNFLDMGYSPSLFWESTPQEIFDLIESYSRREQLRAKEYEANLKASITANTVLAKQIYEYISSIFSSDTKITSLHDFFPNLFEEVKEECNMDLYKVQMEEYAFRHNTKLKREEG